MGIVLTLCGPLDNALGKDASRIENLTTYRPGRLYRPKPNLFAIVPRGATTRKGASGGTLAAESLMILWNVLVSHWMATCCCH